MVERSKAHDLAGYALILALVLCWSVQFPYHQVSAFIGAHFPWPGDRSLKWSGLLTEGLLVQLAVTIPAAVLLYLAARRRAVSGAVLLSVIFGVQTFLSLQHVPSPHPNDVVGFILYLGACHVLLLLGLTYLLCVRGAPAAAG